MPPLQAVADARKPAKHRQSEIQPETVVAAERVVLVTSLKADDAASTAIHDLHRLPRALRHDGASGSPANAARVSPAWKRRRANVR